MAGFDPAAAAESLRQRFGEEGAFFLIDRLRSGGALSAPEQAAIAGIPPERLSEIDRYLEGRLSGAPFALAAGPYEVLKPLIGTVAPQGSGFESSVATSSPSVANVLAAMRGARASGRIVPKPLLRFLQGLG